MLDEARDYDGKSIYIYWIHVLCLTWSSYTVLGMDGQVAAGPRAVNVSA
jgi:hypothetical protein